MTDTVNSKPKLQLGSSFVIKGARSPATPSKLLINHGKPNFTIQRSAKAGEDSANSDQENTKDVLIKSTKSNGVLNNVNTAAKENSSNIEREVDNESSKVVLRRTQINVPPKKSEGDENVPEFILRQRAIQERLAKENVLDFESRRSGYFTHVLISPTTLNRTSFVETMASPAIVPSLEMPAPQPQNRGEVQSDAQKPQNNEISVTSLAEKVSVANDETPVPQQSEAQKPENNETSEVETSPAEKVSGAINEIPVTQPRTVGEVENGSEKLLKEEASVDKVSGAIDDEDVANAIEEVNKAIAGEDVDEHVTVTPVNPALEQFEKTHVEHHDSVEQTQETKPFENGHAIVESALAVPEIHEDKVEQQVEEISKVITTAVSESKQNGHKIDENNNNGAEITISHTNGLEGPRIPLPDPSGALGVNFEPKTVVSFSKDLGAEENKYPDTVKVVHESPTADQNPDDSELRALAKVKFDIKADENDIQVTPVVKTD